MWLWFVNTPHDTNYKKVMLRVCCTQSYYDYTVCKYTQGPYVCVCPSPTWTTRTIENCRYFGHPDVLKVSFLQYLICSIDSVCVFIYVCVCVCVCVCVPDSIYLSVSVSIHLYVFLSISLPSLGRMYMRMLQRNHTQNQRKLIHLYIYIICIYIRRWRCV